MKGILGVCGANGVILYPFANRGLIANIEPRSVFSTPNDKQWKLNFNEPLERDLTSSWRGVQVIIGAPDCGHSSVLAYSRGKKLSDPSKNDSLGLYIEALYKYKPRMFLMENLAKMLENYPELITFLSKKYKLIKFIEPVSFWGNSQVHRKRLVLIGIRKDQPIGYIEKVIKKVTKEYNQKPLKTSGSLIAGLETLDTSICHVREPDEYEIPLYYKGVRKLTTLHAKLIWNTEFKNKSRWEVNMPRMKCQPGVYRNIFQEYPKTVRKQNRQFNHRGEMLTPREMARIQGIPDYFKLWYDPDRMFYCINKARTTVTKTPPHEVASWFYNIISKII